jgi:hypothetical protein
MALLKIAGSNSISSIGGSGGSAVPCGTLDLLYQAPKAEALGYFQESLPGQAKGTERVIGYWPVNNDLLALLFIPFAFSVLLTHF